MQLNTCTCFLAALEQSYKKHLFFQAFEATSKIYTIGCVQALINLGEENLPVIGFIVLGLGIPQLLGICLGRLLSGQVQDQKERWRRSHHR